MNKIFKLLFLILCCVFFSFACKRESLPHQYKTKNIIVIIMDGSRYSETWGDSLHQNIPKLANQISKFGVINTAFYNNGPTYTLAGHTAINTGCYQEINNSGTEIPQYPSIFQYWNKKFMPIQNLSWIISSKDKLEILNNCQQPEWKNKYKPSVNCGIIGIGSGYRKDSLTFEKTIQIFSEQHPQLVLLSFKEPDYIAHTGNWENYLQSIKNTDEFICKIWEYLQSDIFYKGSTTLFVTNDHGRHLDSIANGFASHGDGCSGCRHILFFAHGPDFKQGVITNTKRELTDISATIAELFHFNIIYGNGKVMYELFE